MYFYSVLAIWRRRGGCAASKPLSIATPKKPDKTGQADVAWFNTAASGNEIKRSGKQPRYRTPPHAMREPCALRARDGDRLPGGRCGLRACSQRTGVRRWVRFVKPEVCVALARQHHSCSYRADLAESFPTGISARTVGFAYWCRRSSATFAKLVISGYVSRFGVEALFVFISRAMSAAGIKQGRLKTAGPLGVSASSVSPIQSVLLEWAARPMAK
ncbi:hypothetical protein LMG28140_01700 [Paraburkholderia metrosideri]|uniref:Uncharacterized protein n=1 Tax=Paraburkholderia metrosideri TaxID=580937 RepID=A0ABN7HKX9_9BURK|nr:hypothetical protein LMG28140_01700 [Paraburkholderia metrosideri]